MDLARHVATLAVDIPTGIPCPLRTLTGLDCPLCGATRATFALLRGDVAAALDFNALYVIALPVLAAVAAVWVVQRRKGRPLTSPLASPLAPRLLIGGALAYTIVRNLPFEPFAYLGTT
ncbi:MAG TPA: DUF2752 domain-containing protein [Acidimicrobiales bacterium]